MITVFYDDRCRLCTREIAFYQKLSSPEVLVWAGISSSAKKLAFYQIATVDALMLLHAIDSKGRIHKGVDAFILLWRHLPWFKWLSRVASIPGIYHALGMSYKVFAHYRFARLSHCQAALHDHKVGNKK